MIELKKLHDLLVLIITKPEFLTKIVGRIANWTPEFPVDKGYVDIFVPEKGQDIKEPYVIEIETGYDFNCAGIIQKFRRFQKALKKAPSVFMMDNKYFETSGVEPNMNLVIPKDFEEFLSLFKKVGISVFVWEADGEWKCSKCDKLIVIAAPWKPNRCSSCDKERSFSLVGLNNFKLREVYRVPK